MQQCLGLIESIAKGDVVQDDNLVSRAISALPDDDDPRYWEQYVRLHIGENRYHNRIIAALYKVKDNRLLLEIVSTRDFGERTRIAAAENLTDSTSMRAIIENANNYPEMVRASAVHTDIGTDFLKLLVICDTSEPVRIAAADLICDVSCLEAILDEAADLPDGVKYAVLHRIDELQILRGIRTRNRYPYKNPHGQRFGVFMI